jgi:hypothetical protein
MAEASMCGGRAIVFVGILLKMWIDVPPPPCGWSDLVTGRRCKRVSG